MRKCKVIPILLEFLNTFQNGQLGPMTVLLAENSLTGQLTHKEILSLSSPFRAPTLSSFLLPNDPKIHKTSSKQKIPVAILSLPQCYWRRTPLICEQLPCHLSCSITPRGSPKVLKLRAKSGDNGLVVVFTSLALPWSLTSWERQTTFIDSITEHKKRLNWWKRRGEKSSLLGSFFVC